MDAIDTFLTKRKPLALKQGTHLVGILNLTPDSFSDGGDFVTLETARERFHAMADAGAVIIDIGGESTRPGYEPVSVDEEIRRVVPLVESIRRETEVLISVDTSKSAVAEAALVAGADIINDVWGAQGDEQMAEIIGRHGAACILMHNRPPEEAGKGDIINIILEFWEASVARVQAAGVPKESIILDPGLGFGKIYEENWEVMRKLPALGQAAGYPLLLGASRKSMLAQLLEIKNPKERLHGTLGTTAWAVQAGIDFIRVHDVRENRECVKVIEHCQNYAADTD
jgi:dihydropteroate synthase